MAEVGCIVQRSWTRRKRDNLVDRCMLVCKARAVIGGVLFLFYDGDGLSLNEVQR